MMVVMWWSDGGGRWWAVSNCGGMGCVEEEVVVVKKNKQTVSVTVTNPCEIVHSHTLWPNKNAKLHYLLVKQLHTNLLSIWHL